VEPALPLDQAPEPLEKKATADGAAAKREAKRPPKRK
jgi:hypothetical protein